MLEHFPRPDGLGPASGYSHAVAGRGRLVVVSGQLPVDSSGAVVGAGEPLAQARQVFENLGRALRAAGAAPSDVIRLGFFVTDLADLPAVRTARDEFIAADAAPASTLVQVAGLVLPDARLEVDALAVVDA